MIYDLVCPLSDISRERESGKKITSETRKKSKSSLAVIKGKGTAERKGLTVLQVSLIPQEKGWSRREGNADI